MKMVALSKVIVVSAVALLGWAYQATRPPPPAILGSPGGLPITSPRVRLKDGRHLAYMEAGVRKENATFKVIFVHGFACTKESGFPVLQVFVDGLGIYMLFFDRAGYGDSDANPKRSLKSDATDVEELADALQLGDKFYVVGSSMGGYVAWSCLKYIPHRLAGVSLVVPAVNYWWPLPDNVRRSAYKKLDARSQLTFWIAHHAPSLFHAWLTQKWFPIAPILRGERDAFTDMDWEILIARWRKRLESGQHLDLAKATQQGTYESLCRDMTIMFSTWEFDPTEIKNPFPDGEGVVSIWHGYEDKIVQVEIQRHVAQKLPWVRYHEDPKAGHALADMEGVGNHIITELLLLCSDERRATCRWRKTRGDRT